MYFFFFITKIIGLELDWYISASTDQVPLPTCCVRVRWGGGGVRVGGGEGGRLSIDEEV